MIKLQVFLVCLAVIVFVFSMIVCMEMYALERAIARSIYTDLADDMQDIGYLDPELADYYQARMYELGWGEQPGGFFGGTWPLDEANRARKEKNETVTIAMTVRPSIISQWINQYFQGETEFRFSGTRPSEYFAPGW
ncbi:hypothetical protein [Brevibacillus fulvus]|uniref:Uncharacterized protein n=1 Tax=Brevibacillus fulvus TaxID=1125967 RepID=A0A938XY21_9BACL|nr:hypothetical protein [Brevibacillus fulvus]MBM7592312.1 hypothetical protein [Brevibacillus fulvus]